MYKKIISAVAGLCLVAIATIVPVMAQIDQTPTAEVDVQEFINATITKTTGGKDLSDQRILR